ITAADIPNVFVSVLLIKGRTRSEADPKSAASGATSAVESGFSRTPIVSDTSDPGKPAFRLGYARLQVEDASKRLSLTVKTNKDEFRPAGTATVDVQVVDARGTPAPSEVTLWAVDYGVLSLTGFRVPDVVDSVYVPKMLQVMTEDSRQRIVSRRVLTPKGGDSGGGGGVDSAVNQLRKDFRVLAFWIGSVATDSRGH